LALTFLQAAWARWWHSAASPQTIEGGLQRARGFSVAPRSGTEVPRGLKSALPNGGVAQRFVGLVVQASACELDRTPNSTHSATSPIRFWRVHRPLALAPNRRESRRTRAPPASPLCASSSKACTRTSVPAAADGGCLHYRRKPASRKTSIKGEERT
jgi:hypothetical protein